jgi:hypothetical protein
MSISENPFITAPAAVLGARERSVVSGGMLFDDWLLAETEAALALADWRSAPRAGRAAAYAAYVAALDAEGAAAAQLAQWVSAYRRS